MMDVPLLSPSDMGFHSDFWQAKVLEMPGKCMLAIVRF